LDSLKRHRQLLSDEKLTAVLEEVQESRAVAEDKLDDLSKQIKDNIDSLKETMEKTNVEFQHSLLERKSIITAKLDPPDYEMDQQWAYAQRHSKSFGNWVLEEPSFESWLHGDTLPSGTLYLHGIPGSGKQFVLYLVRDRSLTKPLV
jgi:hypothetical protein